MRLDVPTLVACNVATLWTLAGAVAVVLGQRLPKGASLYLAALVLQGLVAELALLGGHVTAWPGSAAADFGLALAFSISYLGVARLVTVPPFWLAAVGPPLLVNALWLAAAAGEAPSWQCSLLFATQHAATLDALRARLKVQSDRPTLVLAATEAGAVVLLGVRAVAQAAATLGGEPGTALDASGFLLAAQVLMSLHVVAVLLVVQSRALDRAQEQVAHDALTGVASRSCLFGLGPQLLERADAEGRSLSLLMVDLDLFKQVNDRFGHQVGDEVLVAVAQAMRHSLRPSDVIARYGGEEFCVLLYGAGAVQAVEVAERIRENLRSMRPLAIAAELRVTVSIGVAESKPEDRCGFDELLRRADAAMYRVKVAGRNGVAVDGITAVARGKPSAPNIPMAAPDVSPLVR
ncbi:MAG: GGDEF domain-containing protein [Deltaproteobacteria bacterium]|nr:GGDEF domain-containing protein [Deltaproteobacteria bacterium]